LFGYKKQVNLPFDRALAKVREELTREGFGVLTEVNVKATVKKN
jgi:uncharacterized protein (DUF302 family)